MRSLAFCIGMLIVVGMLEAQSYEDLVRHFEYDRKAPLDVREVGVRNRGAVTIHDISYGSPKGGRVPAYLVVPSGQGPFAGAIRGHWYWNNSPQRNRSEFLDEAVVLAKSGPVSLLLTAPLRAPGTSTQRIRWTNSRFAIGSRQSSTYVGARIFS